MKTFTLHIKGTGRADDYEKQVRAENKKEASKKLLNQDRKLVMAGWDDVNLLDYLHEEK